ncbi:hypothetical protein CL629_02165 [bacterium]|nr:hypothetical protein [bacterium]
MKYRRGELFLKSRENLHENFKHSEDFAQRLGMYILLNDVKDDAAVAYLYNLKDRYHRKIRVYNLENFYSRIECAA